MFKVFRLVPHRPCRPVKGLARGPGEVHYRSICGSLSRSHDPWPFSIDPFPSYIYNTFNGYLVPTKCYKFVVITNSFFLKFGKIKGQHVLKRNILF